MRAWVDVTAGVAGDMLMGALIDAGADLDAVGAAIAAVTGGTVTIGTERVSRAGLAALHMHVDIDGAPAEPWQWPALRERVVGADLFADTKRTALAVLDRLGAAYSQGHGLPLEQVTLHAVAGLDVLADVVGDCEALRTLEVDEVAASAVAVGSGAIRTSLGDLPVPVPSVALLAAGWTVHRLPEPDGPPAEHEPSHGVQAGRYVPVANLRQGDGRLTEGPAQQVGRGGLGELATPTGMALLRTFAGTCRATPGFVPRRVGVGAGGRDVPDRPNVVRVLVG